MYRQHFIRFSSVMPPIRIFTCVFALLCAVFIAPDGHAQQGIIGDDSNYFNQNKPTVIDEPYIEEIREKAAKEDAEAQNQLAVAYYTGIGVKKDLEKAISWWTRAAENGSGRANSMIGTMYYQGTGVKKNIIEAIKYWHLAAEKKDPDAMSQLGYVYLLGDSVKKNLTLAYMWFNLAAGLGDQQAIRQRDEISHRISSVQAAEAQRLGNDWQQQISNR